MSVQYQKLLEQYTKSKTLLRENPDDFRRREAFFEDARAYYKLKNPGAANEMKNEMIVSNELNALTISQVNQLVKAGSITNVSNNYHIARSEEDDDSVDRIERKILNICAAKEAGASIVDIITETRAPRMKILPVLEQLQKDQLILVDNNNDGTVVYKLY
jgi:hypothetical protein